MICCQYVANNEEKNPQPYVKQLVTDLKVPRVGIEPTLPKELDFESSASTSSATEAKFFTGIKNTKYFSLRFKIFWGFISKFISKFAH